METRKDKGKKGEELAAKFLCKNGYTILERNFRLKLGEIDLVCKKSNTIVFVEVKTRKNLKFGFPEESVDLRKRAKLNQVASVYISRLSELQPALTEVNLDYRFDIVSIIMDFEGKVNSIKLIENAF